MLAPYLDLVKAAGWLFDLLNGVASSRWMDIPTRNDLKASANLLTET